MVWFRCEDCGENLKKPKLPNHFRICSATKLSCIDCGQTFGQQSVQAHNQCITEAEKYGPKGQAKPANSTTAKTNNGSKPKPDIDINVGLSGRAPWFCSLCNTNATSQQTLLLHAEGKKHRAKARAFHAANQQNKPAEESTPSAKVSTENTPKDELPRDKDLDKPKEQDQAKVAPDDNLLPNKKRKHDASENDGAKKKVGIDAFGELDNGEVIQVERVEGKETECQVKKAKKDASEKDMKRVDSSSAKEDAKKKIKWKKLITSVLKTNPERVMKMRKLRKLLLKSLQESGTTQDETEFSTALEQKIKSSSRFTIDGKFVHLVAKS